MTKRIFGYILIALSVILILVAFVQLPKVLISVLGVFHMSDLYSIGYVIGLLIYWLIYFLFIWMLLKFGRKWIRRGPAGNTN